MWSEWCRFLCLQRCMVLHERQSLSRRIARCLLPTHLVLHSRCAIIAVLASNRWLFVWVIARTLHLMLERKCIKYSTFKKLVYLRSVAYRGRGVGVFNPPLPRNSEDIGGTLDRVSKKSRRLDFLLQFTVFSYSCNLLNKSFF